MWNAERKQRETRKQRPASVPKSSSYIGNTCGRDSLESRTFHHIRKYAVAQ